MPDWQIQCRMQPPDFEPLRDARDKAKVTVTDGASRAVVDAAADAVSALVCRGIDPRSGRKPTHPEAEDCAGPACLVDVKGGAGDVTIRVWWEPAE